MENPSYEQVVTGKTGHAEVCQIEFDPEQIPFEDLLEVFFNMHDPTSLNRQGNDVGTQYRSAIFYHSEEQKEIANRLIEELKGKGYDVKTEIKPAGKFWAAENYHQDYYEKNGKEPYCHVYKKRF